MMAISLLFGSNLMAGDQGKTYENRDQIPEKYKWDLSQLFASKAEWEKEKDAVEAEIPKFKTYQGQLGKSAETLQECLDFMTDVLKRFYKLSAYASQLSDQDTRESKPMAMRQEISQVGNQLSAAMSFIEPEILAIPQNVIDKFSPGFLPPVLPPQPICSI